MASDGSILDQVRKAYGRLSHEQLLLFCDLRSIPIEGSDDELTIRLAEHDLQLYSYTTTRHALSVNGTSRGGFPLQRSRSVKAPDLPIEILAEIMDHLGDWELAKAVGVPTSLPQPVVWTNASNTDHALLTGYTSLIRKANPIRNPPSSLGITAAIRFAYTNALEYLLSHHLPLTYSLFKHDIVPKTASHHGRTAVLEWWRNAQKRFPDVFPKPSEYAVKEAIDGASRNGQVVSLDWWLHSGIPIECTEAALELASAKNHIAVLSWWKTQSKVHKLQLKIGRVMDMASTAGHVDVLEWWQRSGLEPKYDKQAMYHASCAGKVEVLQWWLTSGLQLLFDYDALIGATKHNRAEVLEWWDKSKLPIQFRMCDIEEALEDAIGGGDAARLWWRKKGVDFNANDKEWMKLRNLN